MVAHQSVKVVLKLVVLRCQKVCSKYVNTGLLAKVSQSQADLGLFVIDRGGVNLDYFLGLHKFLYAGAFQYEVLQIVPELSFVHINTNLVAFVAS